MSQDFDERANEVVPQSSKAQILPFERPQSELQKAVQQRAQEAIDRERDRAAARKPKPWRQALVLALAAVPVFITFGAAVGFVGALRQFNTAIFDSSQEATSPPPQQAVDQAPASEPGVVMLQPYVTPAAPARDDGNSTVTRDRP